MLNVSHLSFARGNKLVLKDINLSIENKIAYNISEFDDQLLIDEQNKKILLKNNKI